MKQLLQRIKDGKLKIFELPVPFLQPKGVLVKNFYSFYYNASYDDSYFK